LFYRKLFKIAITIPVSIFLAENVQAMVAGLRPDPVAYSAPPDPLGGLRGGSPGKGRGKGEGRGGVGEEWGGEGCKEKGG